MKSTGGPGRLLPAMRYTIAGLRAAWRHEAAFRQEVTVGVPLIAAAPWLVSEKWRMALLIGVILLVWVVELLNSGLEALCDAVNPDPHMLIAQAKDMGSAAVFLSILIAVLVWVLVI
jgi:diacylglycerol kinase (ATP)